MDKTASAAPDRVELDLSANVAASKYSTKQQLARVLWSFGQWLLILSPHPCYAWRSMVLRAFGATVGTHARVDRRARIAMPWNLSLGEWAAIGAEAYIYNLGDVHIGNGATLSYRAHVCAGTHDLCDPTLPLLKPPVVIGDSVWIGTDAFIGPGVEIAEGAVVGARAVVVSDVAAHTIVAGNPARRIGTRVMRAAP